MLSFLPCLLALVLGCTWPGRAVSERDEVRLAEMLRSVEIEGAAVEERVRERELRATALQAAIESRVRGWRERRCTDPSRFPTDFTMHFAPGGACNAFRTRCARALRLKVPTASVVCEGETCRHGFPGVFLWDQRGNLVNLLVFSPSKAGLTFSAVTGVQVDQVSGLFRVDWPKGNPREDVYRFSRAPVVLATDFEEVWDCSCDR